MRLTKPFHFMLLLGLLLSCGPVQNSASLDATRFGTDLDLTGSSALFTSVRTALSKCQDCHGSWLSMKEADFVSVGLVVGGSPASSKLYYRNQGATSGPGPHNMPSVGYPALTAEELTNMANWINGL